MKKSKARNLFSKFGFFANIFFTGIMLLVYLSVLVPSDSFWPAAFLGFLYPYLLVIHLLFVCVYALLKSKKALLSLGILLLGYQHFFNFFQPLPHFGTEGKGLKVLTYNVHFFTKNSGSSESDRARILEFLRKENASIICLQECRFFKSGKLAPGNIMEALPGIKYMHRVHRSSNDGPMTLSKFPIINMGEIRFEKSANMVLFSDIVIKPGDTIRVYNCHFQSYRIAPGNYTLTDPGKEGTNEQQLREARLISRKMIPAFKMRAIQVRTVASHIEKCRYPVILCGDFNDTPLSYAYHLLRKQLNDSFAETGFGSSNTYAGFLPLFRIDYILHSQRFRAISYQRKTVELSDHYPVTAVLEWIR